MKVRNILLIVCHYVGFHTQFMNIMFLKVKVVLMKKQAHTFAIQVLCDALYMLGACSQDHHAKLLALSFLLQIHMKDIKYKKGCFLQEVKIHISYLKWYSIPIFCALNNVIKQFKISTQPDLFATSQLVDAKARIIHVPQNW